MGCRRFVARLSDFRVYLTRLKYGVARLVVEPAREVRPQPGAVRKVRGGQHLRLRPAVRHAAVRVCLYKFHAFRHMRHLPPSLPTRQVWAGAGKRGQQMQHETEVHGHDDPDVVCNSISFLALTLHACQIWIILHAT